MSITINSASDEGRRKEVAVKETIEAIREMEDMDKAGLIPKSWGLLIKKEIYGCIVRESLCINKNLKVPVETTIKLLKEIRNWQDLEHKFRLRLA